MRYRALQAPAPVEPLQPPPLFTKRRKLVLAATVAFLTLPVTGSMVPPNFGGLPWYIITMVYGLLVLCFLMDRALGGTIALVSIVFCSLRGKPYREDYRFRVVHSGVAFASIFAAMVGIAVLKGPPPTGSNTAASTTRACSSDIP